MKYANRRLWHRPSRSFDEHYSAHSRTTRHYSFLCVHCNRCLVLLHDGKRDCCGGTNRAAQPHRRRSRSSKARKKRAVRCCLTAATGNGCSFSPRSARTLRRPSCSSDSMPFWSCSNPLLIGDAASRDHLLFGANATPSSHALSQEVLAVKLRQLAHLISKPYYLAPLATCFCSLSNSAKTSSLCRAGSTLVYAFAIFPSGSMMKVCRAANFTSPRFVSDPYSSVTL
jgi:hypothetical protein